MFIINYLNPKNFKHYYQYHNGIVKQITIPLEEPIVEDKYKTNMPASSQADELTPQTTGAGFKKIQNKMSRMNLNNKSDKKMKRFISLNL
jgi:hypothetical protein